MLKYTTETILSVNNEIKNLKTTSTKVDTSNLEWKITNLKNQIESGGGIIGLNSRVTNLEQKIDDVCGWIFSGFSISCPSVRFGSEKLEDRIKKLEGRY